MQQGKTQTTDSGSAKRLQSFQSSSRRTGDMEVPNKMLFQGEGNRQLLHSNNSSDQESNQYRMWASCEEDRPNNWQDCHTWPVSVMHKTGQQSTDSDGYDKWARHADQRSPRDKSKTNNVTDSPTLSPGLQNKTSAFVKHQHLPSKQQQQTLKAETTRGRGGGSLTAGHDESPRPRYPHPDSGSPVAEDRTRLSQIWTALGDLLPQTQISLDKMDSSEIVSQVMKIRDSLKSASSLLIALGKQPDTETTKLQRDYLDAIFELLRKQETCYLVALQRSLVSGEDDRCQSGAAERASPKSDSKSEEPTELEISESSNDELENPTGGAAGDAEFPLNNQRPMIEDHLGHYSDSDLDELQQKLNSLNDTPWPDSLALPRVPSCISSHRSPRSPVVRGRSVHSQKFRFDCLPAGSDAQSQPCHTARNTFQRDSNLEGSDDQGPSTAAAPHPAARLQARGHFDDKLLDSAAGLYGCLPSDISNDALEDLSQLMKKKHELESFLVERNRQLRDLQQHHDLLKDLLLQQEENAAILQGMDEEQGTTARNTDRLKLSPRREENLTGMPSPRTKRTVAAAARSQPSPLQGGSASLKPVSHQKNLLKESSRVKSDTKDSSNFLDDMRTCEKEDQRMPVLSSRPGMSRDRLVPADWSALQASSDSLQYFADCDRARKKDGVDAESSALNPNLIEKKYLQKNRVDFELEEEAALAEDADDPNSSLALRDELQHCKDRNDGYLTEFCNTLMQSYDENEFCCRNDETSLQPLHNPENSILMLQQNMSKLMEAKKELEALRIMLHFSTQRRSEKTQSMHESGQRNDHSNGQLLREPRSGGGNAVASDQTESYPDMMRLSLLKVANEKLDRLKLVMDDVQRSPRGVSLASLPVDRTASADGASVTKASNTPTASNFTLRNMQVSDLSSADRSRSQNTVDVLDDRLNASGLDRLLRLLSIEKPRCNDGTLPVPSSKAPRQSAMKEGFFIRNSLPESVSSRGTSRPPSDGRGGLETNSRCPKGNRKGVSKNSSTTNFSNASCVPCISLSADCLPLETGYENIVSTVPPQEKNSKKPCKVIRNQHVEFQHAAHVSKPSATFVRDSSQGASYSQNPNMHSYPKKGVNVGKKHAAVNTERVKHRDCEQNDTSEMRTELKAISQDLKILRQDVIALTQTIDRNSERPASEARGDALDPKLLLGLNQSFQQLMADNRRLSDHFAQLRDFVLEQTMRKQCTCEATDENIFNKNTAADSSERRCRHSRPNSSQLTCDDRDKRCPEQDDTWVKSTHRLGAREVRFRGNQNVKHHAGHLLSYLDNDLNTEPCHSQAQEAICQQDIYGNCFANNSNENNSGSHVSNYSPAAALLPTDDVSSHSLSTLLPHSSRKAVCSFASGSPARSQSSGKSADNQEYRFNALKETIYSEVAVFISKHESRPYYLLELIRELQKLKTDALQQKAVDTLDRIISKFLTNDEFQMQVPHEYQVKRETVGDVQLQSGTSLLYDSDIPGFSHFPGANSSSISGVSGDIAEDEESEGEEQEDVDRCNVSCTIDPVDLKRMGGKVVRNRGVEEEDDEQEEEGGSSCHSTGKSDDRSSTDPDRLEDGRCIESGLESESESCTERDALDEDGKCSLSSTDDVQYAPDFKSDTSSSCPEAETETVTDDLAADVANPADHVSATHNLDATAEQMGFVTVEFIHAPTGDRSNSGTEKGSSVSDESWEKAELPEKNPDLHPTESDTSEEIAEEIIVEDCGSSGSVEELTLDQLRERLTSISKEEIAKQMALECQGELSAQQILDTIDTEPQNELAGDQGSIKQPASPFDKEESRRV